MSAVDLEKSDSAAIDLPALKKEESDRNSNDEKIEVTDISSMTDAQKTALFRKVDGRIVPLLILLLTMSFVDRGNIGNALSLGLIKSLKLQIGLRTSWVACIFYIAYGLFEVPSQLMIKVVGPSKWIPAAMFAWGLTMALSCLVKTYDNLLVVRFILGMTEAGIVPGAMYYLSLWYPRERLALRSAYIFATASVGLAWGGLLAYGIDKMSGRAGLQGWAWIFAIEGAITCVLAIMGFFLLEDSPEVATFLSTTEKAQLIEILRKDRKGASTEFKWKWVFDTLLDWKVYVLVALYFGLMVPTFDIALFLPTIIKDLGYGASNAQLLLVPPHIVAWFFAVGVATISDRIQIRAPFIQASSIVGIIGFAMLRLPSGSKGVGYAGTFFAVVGTLTCVPVTLAWISVNAGSEMKRAVTLGFVLGCASLGGIVTSFTYQTKESPHYKTGHDVAMGMLALVFLSSTILLFTYSRLNKAKEAECARDNIDTSSLEELGHLNDASPLFKYSL
jgi:MFS family permease